MHSSPGGVLEPGPLAGSHGGQLAEHHEARGLQVAGVDEPEPGEQARAVDAGLHVVVVVACLVKMLFWMPCSVPSIFMSCPSRSGTHTPPSLRVASSARARAIRSDGLFL
ncbi:unnamed protein product [Plutella xylostella]|uniref:(diamondback moth) hypothetical protein n=1 Tax=Plutella xylostella TaxID=51655 RepID=A0A8S4DQ97_PLUXY|nr:unnamed protein product [Plutella xylostella]